MADLGTGTNLTTSRRTIVRGAAWSVPVVAVAATAPAFAASPCTDGIFATMDWSVPRYYRQGGQNRDRGYGYTRTNNSTATYLTQDPDGGGPQLPISVNISVSYGSNTTADVDQLFLSDVNIGGTGAPGLTFHQTPANVNNLSSTLNNANKSVITFAFSRPVTEMSFTMTDIDSASSDFRDAVGIAGATISSFSIANTGQVGGVGTVANPFKVIPNNSAIDNTTGTGGNVNVTLTNFSTFELHYWNGQPAGSGGDQKVFFTNPTVKYYPC
jgi:hypothetical protein